MAGKHSDKRAKELKKKGWEAYLLPVLFFVCIYPLITRIVLVQNDYASYSWFSQESARVDFFLFFKSRVLIAGAAVMLVLLLDMWIIQGCTLRVSRWMSGILIGLSGVLFSAFLSDRRHTSFWGGTESFEGALALISYGVLFFYSMQVTGNVKILSDRVKKLISCLFAAYCIVLIITGISQFAGSDIFKNILIQQLIAGPGVKDRLSDLSFADTKKGLQRVYLTLYSFDQAGVYLAMLLPVAGFAFIRTKKKAGKVFWAVIFAGLFICLTGTGSRAAAAVYAVTFLAAELLRYTKKRKEGTGKKPGTALLCMVILTAVVYVFVQRGGHEDKGEDALTNVRPYSEGVEFESDGRLYIFDQEGKLREKSGKRLKTEQAADGYYYTKDTGEIGFLSDSIPEGSRICLYYNGVVLEFVKTRENRTYMYRNLYGNLTELEYPAPIRLIPGRIFNHRGYIWTRTLTILSDSILWGTGCDMFAVAFPQYDYIGKAGEGEDFFGQVIMSPHSMYLQSMVQNGIIPSIALLASVLYVVIRSLLKVMKKPSEEGICIVSGLVNYLLCAFFYDSCVAVSPFFWILLGAAAGLYLFEGK